MIISMEKFGRYFTDFRISATRIETLPAYAAPEEADNFAAYLRGEPLPVERHVEWSAGVRKAKADGKYMGRVHIIEDRSLNPYLQFEVYWYYDVAAGAGEDIRFIFREDVPDVEYQDTWIFDDETVLDLAYTSEGRLLYVNENDHPDRLEQARTAWQKFHERSFTLAELHVRIRNSNIPVPKEKCDERPRTAFVINDQVKGYPTRTVATTATQADIQGFIKDGYLVRRNLLDPRLAAEMAAAVTSIARAEAVEPGSEQIPGKTIYMRALLDKDSIFHQLLRFEPALSLARTLLGPQVWVDLEARMNYPGEASVAVPWHGHVPVIPAPLPPLFCYPHQVQFLIYLDRITEREGALCLLPGSHARSDIQIPFGDSKRKDGQVELLFEPGDAVLIHANMWHQTVPSRENAGPRRLLLLGYVPSWIRSDGFQTGVRPEKPLTRDLASSADEETRELLGGLSW
jgi:ectoine hydroxylase-related dioxygenase (phytanoyl-CoA dioxygenase family)